MLPVGTLQTPDDETSTPVKLPVKFLPVLYLVKWATSGEISLIIPKQEVRAHNSCHLEDLKFNLLPNLHRQNAWKDW